MPPYLSPTDHTDNVDGLQIKPDRLGGAVEWGLVYCLYVLGRKSAGILSKMLSFPRLSALRSMHSMLSVSDVGHEANDDRPSLQSLDRCRGLSRQILALRQGEASPSS